MTDMLARTVPEAGERERSFADEFDRLFALAVGVARARGFGESDARRVGVDVMARCYASWNRVSVDQQAEAWVQKTAHRVCTDLVRRGVQVRDDRAAVAEVLKALPRREREAAELCVLGDVAPPQAAVALGRSVVQVQAALDAARARLGDVGVPQPVAPVVVAVDPATKADAIARGRRLKNARLTMRGAAAAMVVIVVAFTGWAVLGRSTNQPPPANTTTSTTTTTLDPTTTTTLDPATTTAPNPPTSAVPPTTATGPGAPAPVPPASDTYNDAVIQNLRQYFTVSIAEESRRPAPRLTPLAPPSTIVVFRVRATRTDVGDIGPTDFGRLRCSLRVRLPNGAVSTTGLRPCAEWLGPLQPGAPVSELSELIFLDIGLDGPSGPQEAYGQLSVWPAAPTADTTPPLVAVTSPR